MRFWDSSAVVPLLVADAHTPRVTKIYADAPEMIVWWATEVECASAIARREREGALSPRKAEVAMRRLDLLGQEWHELDPGDRVRSLARRLLRVHDLRAADALQLAAAHAAAEGEPRALELVILDARLAQAARRESFLVTPEEMGA